MGNEEDREVFATQGGGYVVIENGWYVFVELPKWDSGLQLGDPLPREWSVTGPVHHKN